VSSLFTTSGKKLSKVQSYITLAIWDVKDIGRRSSSILFGGTTLGTGTTIDLFNAFGKVPCVMDELKMSEITGASSKANVFRILFGNMSGPGDFVVLILRSFL
jgi:hypothetical protein